MVYNSLKAEILNEKKFQSKVINIHTIKPIDKKSIEEANETNMIFSVEEHNVIGGLGSAIAEHLSSLKKSVKLIRLGLQDNYSCGGSYEFLQKNMDSPR